MEPLFKVFIHWVKVKRVHTKKTFYGLPHLLLAVLPAGYGFRGYPELRNIDIKRDVKAYLRDEDGLVGDEVEKEQKDGEETGG